MYIHPDIKILDTRKLHAEHIKELSKIYNIKETSFLHIFLFSTDLPKRLLMRDNCDSNPYHLLFYMIAKFYYFDNGTDEIHYHYPKKNYLSDSALSLLPSRFIRVDKDDNYEYVEFPGCKYLVDSVEEPWMYSYVRDLYKDIWNKCKHDNKKIYIMRTPEKVSTRAVMNEESLIPMLKGLGFSCYALENLTFLDTILLFRSASFVTGSHGAGLSWMIFCRPRTVLVEIYKEKDNKAHFSDICNSCDLYYYRCIAASEARLVQPENSQDAHIVVDVDSYKNVLEHLMRHHANDDHSKEEQGS